MTSKNTDIFRIKIVNSQSIDDQEQPITEQAPCSFRTASGKAYITYKTEGSVNMLKVDGDTVTIKRTGSYGSEMQFEKGKHFEFMYRTPYGSIPMCLFTKDAKSSLNESGGTVYIDYTLDTNGDKIQNKMTITIERQII